MDDVQETPSINQYLNGSQFSPACEDSFLLQSMIGSADCEPNFGFSCNFDCFDPFATIGQHEAPTREITPLMPLNVDSDVVRSISIENVYLKTEFCNAVKGLIVSEAFFGKGCDVIISQEKFRTGSTVQIPIRGKLLYPTNGSFTVDVLVRTTDAQDDKPLFSDTITLHVDTDTMTVFSTVNLVIDDALTEQAMCVNKRRSSLQLLIVSGIHVFSSIAFKVYNRNVFSDFKTRELLSRCIFSTIDNNELRRDSNVQIQLTCMSGDVFSPKLSAVEVELEHVNGKTRADVKSTEVEGNAFVKLHVKVPRIDINSGDMVRLVIKFVVMEGLLIPYVETKKRKEFYPLELFDEDAHEDKRTRPNSFPEELFK
jgi:hypothetical protein